MKGIYFCFYFRRSYYLYLLEDVCFYFEKKKGNFVAAIRITL